MKLKTTLLFIGALVVVLSAAPKVGLDKILSSRKLVVGTTGDFPPFTAQSKSGELMGMDIDITRLMADAMGVKQVIKQLPFDELIPALESGEIDIIASGMSITPDRNLRVSFVGPYFLSGKSVISKESFISSVTNSSDLNKKEYQIVAVKGSTSEKVAKTLMDSAEVQSVKTFDEALAQVLDGRVTGLIADYPYCAVAAYRFRDKGITIPKEPFTFEPIGFAVNREAVAFVNWLENYLMTLDGNGILTDLQERWFNEMGWIERLPEPRK